MIESRDGKLKKQEIMFKHSEKNDFKTFEAGLKPTGCVLLTANQDGCVCSSSSRKSTAVELLIDSTENVLMNHWVEVGH